MEPGKSGCLFPASDRLSCFGQQPFLGSGERPLFAEPGLLQGEEYNSKVEQIGDVYKKAVAAGKERKDLCCAKFRREYEPAAKKDKNRTSINFPILRYSDVLLMIAEAENEYIRSFCEKKGCEFALSEVWEKGGEGGIALAEKVLDTLENKESHFHTLYQDELSLEEKIETISKEIYGARGVVYEPAAKKQLAKITSMGFGALPVCMAKNQYSLSDDAKKLGRPADFDIHIREVYVSAGAGFVVALTGAIMTMPGLPKVPAANGIDVSDDGKITGLF